MHDDEDEYDQADEGNSLLGFMFGNVSISGDLDVDYLDEDAKEHLSALADKLGPSLTDINIKSSRLPTDALEQDYDEKAEDAVDYEDFDEQYDGPEIQSAIDEDELAPEKEYLSSHVPLESFNPKACVFDDDNYDEDGEAVIENEVFFRGKQLEPRESKESSSDVDVPFAESFVPEADEDQASFMQDKIHSMSESALPVLCTEDGMIILRFSEIFGVHGPLMKTDRKDRHHRQYIIEEHARTTDHADIVEEDEFQFLSTYSHNTHASRRCSSKYSYIHGEGEDPISEVGMHGKYSSLSAQPMKDNMSFFDKKPEPFGRFPEIYPLDQIVWEDKILWGNSPTSSHGCSEVCVESESLSDTETEGLSMEESNVGNKRHMLSNSFACIKSISSLDSIMLAYAQSLEVGHHGNASCLGSSSLKDDDCLLIKDGNVPPDVSEGNFLSRFNKISFINKDFLEGTWVDQVIWDSEQAIPKQKLILDLQDDSMFFEILDNKNAECIRSHASAVVVVQSSNASIGDIACLHNKEIPYSAQFNISNDKFYFNRKISEQVKSQDKRRATHGIKVLHSIPALRLQTLKPKLRNKDVANFHRPRALWYPRDNLLMTKFQGALCTDGLIKIIVFCLGGKIIKLSVDPTETVSSVKQKASRKLDLRTLEKLKLFYLGKLLEDNKSLALQNVCPNSVIHLVRSTICVWPRAQRLPGENKPLHPPGAFKKRSDLSVKDGHVFLMEYCEERPLLLGNAGMGARLCTYYQKSLSSEHNASSMCNGIYDLGSLLVLDPADKSPFLGDIGHGRSQLCLETNMYRAPIFPHKLFSADYLLVRSKKGTLSIRRVDKLYVAGQQEPHMEAFSPGSKNVQIYLATRMLIYIYHQFRAQERHGVIPFVSADVVATHFMGLTDAYVRKRLRHCADLKGANGKLFWVKRSDFRIPPEEVLRRMLTPETVCLYESMQAGLYRLKCLGISQLTNLVGLSSAMSQLPDEAIVLAAASHIERELQITSWNLTNNFMVCMNQDRENIERLEITGFGDPSGHGLGFSYVRVAPKVPSSGVSVKKKPAAACGSSIVTGTDADLRKLSMDAAREVLLKFRVPEEQISKLTRWHRIAMVRKLSSEQAAAGIKIDSMTLTKFARGQRMSFLQLQQQAKEKCQEIWERQLQSLSAAYGDENESDSDGNSDLDSFAGDLENLLGAEEFEEEETGHADLRGGKDGCARLLKMRRCSYEFQTKEEIEDDEEEASLIYRLLDDNTDDTKKKKSNETDVGADNFYESVLSREIMMHDLDEVPKEKMMTSKPIRDNFVCGACGQLGHMRTNKNCPRNKDIEASDHEADTGKPCAPDVAQGHQKALIKKSTVKVLSNISQAEMSEGGENITLQGKVPSLKFKCGTIDKPSVNSALLFLDRAARDASDRDLEPNTTGKISKIKFSTKTKMESSPHGIRLPSLVRPPDKDRLSTKIIIKKPKNVHAMEPVPDATDIGLADGGSRKMKTIGELSGFLEHHQENPWSDVKIKDETLHDRSFWSERGEKDGTERERTRRSLEGERKAHVERPRRLFASKSPREVIKMDKGQKSKKKKKKKHEFSDDDTLDHPKYGNALRTTERSRAAKRRQSFGEELEYAPPTKRRRGGQVDLSNILVNIVDSLRENIGVSRLFLRPVSRKDAPDYHTIIKCPMDLSTIRDKAQRMGYPTREEFRHDVCQITFNAHRYNDGRNPGIPPLADQLLELCDYLIELNSEALDNAEADGP